MTPTNRLESRPPQLRRVAELRLFHRSRQCGRKAIAEYERPRASSRHTRPSDDSCGGPGRYLSGVSLNELPERDAEPHSCRLGGFRATATIHLASPGSGSHDLPEVRSPRRRHRWLRNRHRLGMVRGTRCTARRCSRAPDSGRRRHSIDEKSARLMPDSPGQGKTAASAQKRRRGFQPPAPPVPHSDRASDTVLILRLPD